MGYKKEHNPLCGKRVRTDAYVFIITLSTKKKKYIDIIVPKGKLFMQTGIPS